jgi:transmembrane sensor
MNEPRADLDDDGVAEAAAGWFVRLQGEDASGDDWLAFERWLAAAPAHARAYRRIERIWVEVEAQAPAIAAALDTVVSTPAPRRARRATPPPRFASRRTWLAGAGALAASLALVVVMVAERPPAQPPATSYSAAPGTTRIIRLADGTQVRLNAASTLRVSLGSDARRVTLADGEAAFDVTHDPKRPFLIAVGDRQVRVVGTEFNLRHRGGLTELTVRRGVVEVRPEEGAAQPVRVAAGQQLAHRDGAAATRVSPVDPGDAFAWTAGQLIYRDRPLSEVAADLTRRFGRPISTADARTGDLRFTGVLVTDDETAVIHRLEGFAPVKAEQIRGGIVLRRTEGGR